jgi:hypothetical protein
LFKNGAESAVCFYVLIFTVFGSAAISPLVNFVSKRFYFSPGCAVLFWVAKFFGDFVHWRGLAFKILGLMLAMAVQNSFEMTFTFSSL